MNLRLAKLYLALAIFCCASFLFWVGVTEWIGGRPSTAVPLHADAALPLSLLGLGLAGRIGWQTVLAELAVTSN